MATGATTKYAFPYPVSTDPVNVSGDIQQLSQKIDDILQETIEDTSSAQWTGGTFSNGLNAPTYNDTTGKMSMSLSQDLQTTATPTFTGVNLVGGDLYLGPSRSIIFEGSSDDGFETTFTVTNPTADRTITFQNATGTVAFTSEASMTSLLNIASATGAITLQMGYGATTNGTTKAINIGPNGVSGSITNINIGSSVSGALGTTTIYSPTTSLAGDITIATGKSYQINSVPVLSSTTLGSSVVNSSLTSVGTITTGVWSGTSIATTKGGTGLSTGPTANGQLLIGSSGGTYTLATLTQGTGMSITNGSGSISLAVASVPNSQIIKFDTGVTEGTDLYTFNGSAAKTIDIKAGTNISLSKSAGSIIINASGVGTTTSDLALKFDSGTTEGTDLYTFNGSASKTVNLVAGTNITLTKTAGTVTIDSTGSASSVGFEATMFLGGL